MLINFDVDGVGRIYRAGESAGHERNLNAIFGDNSWKEALDQHASFQHLCRAILALYLDRLRSLPNIRYVFPFEMRTSSAAIDYFLVFASQHPMGLKKMKGAMRKIDQNGTYRFSDAHVGNQALFRFDEPEDFAMKLHRRFAGKAVTYAEVNDFALNETPFDNPKIMLRWLDKREMLNVDSSNKNRRPGDFPESTTKWIEFKDEVPDG